MKWVGFSWVSRLGLRLDNEICGAYWVLVESRLGHDHLGFTVYGLCSESDNEV